MSAELQHCETCGKAIPADTTAFLHEGKVVCRECHDAAQPICPTCGEDLPETPETTQPCPLCGWPIHVVRDQDLFDTTLLSQGQAEEVRGFRQKLGVLRRYGVTEGLYMRTRARIEAETGQPAEETALMRQLFFKAIKSCKTAAESAALLHAEARYLYDHEEAYFPVLKRAHEQHLKALKAQGIDGVTIVGPPTCAYCRKRAGVPLPIDREKKHPELPYPDCPNKTVSDEVRIDGEVARFGVKRNAFCQARYQPCRDAGA